MEWCIESLWLLKCLVRNYVSIGDLNGKNVSRKNKEKY